MTIGNCKKVVKVIPWYFCAGVFSGPLTLLNWALPSAYSSPHLVFSAFISFNFRAFCIGKILSMGEELRSDYLDPPHCTVGAKVTWICPTWQFLQQRCKHGCYISLPAAQTYLAGQESHSSYSLHTFLHPPLFAFSVQKEYFSLNFPVDFHLSGKGCVVLQCLYIGASNIGIAFS